MEKTNLNRIEIGTGTRFQVPVRGGGNGSIMIGKSCFFGFPEATRLGSGEILLQAREPHARILIGDGNHFSNNVSLIANQNITLGNACLVGDFVTIMDCDFHEIAPAFRMSRCGPIKQVTIGNNVWLGSRVMVLKGVTIGDNSVIGALSLVTTDIPQGCIAAGVPAKVIRKIE